MSRTDFTKVWSASEHHWQAVNLNLTCYQIEPVILDPHQFELEVVLPTRCSHYTSQKLSILIRDPFEM